MAVEKEETLYVGMMRDKYELLREGSLQRNGNAHKFLYFAALPKSKSDGWHTNKRAWTFKPNGRRLVAYQSPCAIYGFPVIEIDEERSVEKRYEMECMEARKIPRSAWYPGITFTPDKELTYVFLEELPKFVPEYGTMGWELKRETDFDRIIYRLEENFEPEAERAQRHRDNAPHDNGDYFTGIGLGHGDD